MARESRIAAFFGGAVLTGTDAAVNTHLWRIIELARLGIPCHAAAARRNLLVARGPDGMVRDRGNGLCAGHCPWG